MPPNAPDQKGAEISALRKASAPDFCIWMLEASLQPRVIRLLPEVLPQICKAFRTCVSCQRLRREMKWIHRQHS